MPKIKLFVAFAFLAFAFVAFLFSSNKSQAQTGKTDARRDEVLEKVANYKNWNQVQKTELRTETGITPLISDVLTISDSSPAG